MNYLRGVGCWVLGVMGGGTIAMWGLTGDWVWVLALILSLVGAVRFATE